MGGEDKSAGESPEKKHAPQRVCLVLDKGNLLRWHMWLIDSLRSRYDVAVSLTTTEDAARLPAACRVAFDLERLIYGIPPGAAVDRIRPEEIAGPAPPESRVALPFDVAVNCTSGGGHVKAERTLTLLFDGVPSELGVLAALFDDRPVLVEIEDSQRPQQNSVAAPALADRKVLTRALDNACSVAIDLIVKTIESDPPAGARGSLKIRPAPRSPRLASTLRYVARSLTWKANRFLSLQLSGREQWSVAYRKSNGRSLISEHMGEFTLLPDDGRRYFADPFVLRWRNHTALFMEEFPLETMRGQIAVATVDDNGVVSQPRPALEEGYHLSYPNVFESDGEVWMVPESGANASVDLYRAIDFPFRWKREATLLDGVVASDATLMRDRAGWWMFAATRLWRATGWDSLSVFYAPSLLGPWRACRHNPVVLDATAARPAGAIISNAGVHLRPVQDCEAYYGAAVGIWRIDRIDNHGFEQTHIARIESKQFGVHTFNSAAGLEVVDAFGKTRGCRTVTLACKPIGNLDDARVDEGARPLGVETSLA